jgi:phosphoribosylformylglycinamidine synthase
MVLGVCNGFQIACEAGLLPGLLMRNANLRFVSRMQHIRVERGDTAFTRDYAVGQVLDVAIAHGEGNYVCDADTLARLRGENRIAFRYCDAAGRVGGAANPNGATDDIAGILSDNGRVLGMMPHPENAIDAATGSVDGLGMFTSLAAGGRMAA